MGDWLKDMGKAISNVGKAASNEAGRVVNEAGRHMTESIQDIEKGVKEGGFVGGAIAAADKLSFGNMAAGAVDSIIPGKDLPGPVVDGISLFVNIGTANSVPALIDGFQLLGGLFAGGATPQLTQQQQVAAQDPAATQMQSPESPTDAAARQGSTSTERSHARHGRYEAYCKETGYPRRPNTDGMSTKDKNLALKHWAEAKAEWARKHDHGAHRGDYLGKLNDYLDLRPHGGFGSVPGDAGGFISNDFIGFETGGGKGTKGAKDPKLAKLERALDAATRDIERILNDPSLSFEDMIFLLMRAVIKQSEAEVKIELQNEKSLRKDDKAARDAGRAEINKEQNALNKEQERVAGLAEGPEKEKAKAGLATKRSELEQKQQRLSDSVGDRAEARNEKFEELKEALQKVSEMQQALSNIMNTLHQTAMNAIGNIR